METRATATDDPATGPAVTVVVPCRDEVRHIEACLRSVLAFEEPPGGFEVVVADGMSEDGTRDILRRIAGEDPRVRLVDNPARTTPCALNAALRAARAEYVARVDAHTEYAPDYLRLCIEVMHETGADNVGGPARTRATTYWQRAVAAAYHSRFAVGNAVFHQPGYEGPADTVPYGCYRRERLIQLGGYDEELTRNQDDELNFRLIRAGGRIWQSPRIRSWYTPRGSLLALFRQYFQYGYWKVRVMQKHGRPASGRHLVPGAFLACLVALALAAPFLQPAKAGLEVLAGSYLALLLTVSVLVAGRNGRDLLPVLPPVFACYHFGYGLGFLAGVWDFGIRHRSVGRFVSLTRS